MFKTSLAFMGLLMLCALPCQAQVRIYNSHNELQATIEPGIETVITANGQKLFRQEKQTDKVRYINSDNDVLLKANHSKEGFKLKQGESKTLWKVKYKDYGLKIATNDEMKNAYKVKRSSGKYKLKKDDDTLAKIKTKGKDYTILRGDRLLMTVKGGKPEFLPVLAIPDVGWMEKLVLYTELSRSR